MSGAAAYNSISSIFAKAASTLPASMGIPAYTDVNTTAVFTVAGLPVAAAVGAGARAFVNDANAATFNTLLAAGGANKVPVFSDGAAWRIG